MAAMDKLEAQDENKYKHLKDYYLRVFHPKATPYGVQATRNIEVIMAARGRSVDEVYRR